MEESFPTEYRQGKLVGGAKQTNGSPGSAVALGYELTVGTTESFCEGLAPRLTAAAKICITQVSELT